MYLNQKFDKDLRIIVTPVNSKPYLTLDVLTPAQKTHWISSAVNSEFKKEFVHLVELSNYNKDLAQQFRKQIEIEDSSAKKKYHEILATTSQHE